MSHTSMSSATSEQCIDSCTECAEICKSTAEYCLELGGRHAEPGHIAMLRECATVCSQTAEAISANADNLEEICNDCASSCQACETECRSFGDDKTMLECADACKQCATLCQHSTVAA